jgi:hypothetical protein
MANEGAQDTLGKPLLYGTNQGTGSMSLGNRPQPGAPQN